MSTETVYDEDFFLSLRDGSYRSAKVVVQIVNQFISPRSVCDVGCGIGAWLRAWSELGVDDLYGLDGDYVDASSLMISPEQFHSCDLRQRLVVDRTFDLAMSLEVAEHLPPERGISFIEDVTSLAPVVLFSAAVPEQGGTNHINEQWQDYWADLFRDHGFLPIDVVRPAVWDNREVMTWYKQKVLLFCSETFSNASRFA